MDIHNCMVGDLFISFHVLKIYCIKWLSSSCMVQKLIFHFICELHKKQIIFGMDDS